MKFLFVCVAGTGLLLAGLTTHAPAQGVPAVSGQTTIPSDAPINGAINDTNTATVLGAPKTQPGITPQGVAPAMGPQGIGVPPAGSPTLVLPGTGSGTAIGPQSSQPAIGQQGSGTAIGPQSSQPAIGQQGSGTAIGPQNGTVGGQPANAPATAPRR